MTEFFNTCLPSAEEYDTMMADLASGGRFALDSSHCSEASYDLSGIIKILEIFLRDFEEVSLGEKLNDMKESETLVFSNFEDGRFKFVAIDIKPKFERTWFGFGPVKRTYFKTYLINMEVSIQSKDKFKNGICFRILL